MALEPDVRAVRYSREVESALAQYRKYANGTGNSSFSRGHEFAFESSVWTPENQKRVLDLMTEGATFDDAFDAVRASITPNLIED
jgi:hypothetical protein